MRRTPDLINDMHFLLLLLLPMAPLASSHFQPQPELRHVAAIFRHADRAPLTTFPGDPNRNHRWPLGIGRLTTRGRANAYALGKWLRTRYSRFLTEDPHEVDARSSPVPRCYESAALALYGLYPSNRDQKLWMPDQDWQPIPITRLPEGTDKYATICMPRLREAIKSLLEEPRYAAGETPSQPAHFRTLAAALRFVARMTNVTAESPSLKFIAVTRILDAMFVAREYNLSVPTWASRYWRELEWATHAVIEGLSRSQMDHMAGALLSDVLAKIMHPDHPQPSLMRGSHNPNAVPKLTLMAYHDINIAGILLGLNKTLERRPPYGAAVLMEVFTLTSTVSPDLYVRVLYKAGESVSKLAVDSCTDPCSLRDFGELLQRKFKPVSRAQCEWSQHQPLL